MGGGSSEGRALARAQRVLGEGLIALQARLDKLDEELGSALIVDGAGQVRVEERLDQLEARATKAEERCFVLEQAARVVAPGATKPAPARGARRKASK